MILMPQIFDVIANENACYKRNELESVFYGVFGVGLRFVLLEQTKLLDAEFKYLIIFFNLSKINFAKLKQK